MDFRLGTRFDFDDRGARSRRASSRSSTTCRCRAGTLLNVNVPAGERRRRRGRRASASAIYRDQLKLDEEERRRASATGSTAPIPGFDDEPGTDLAAVAAGRIAVTPLHFDLTDRRRHGRARRSTTSQRLLAPAAEEVE